MEDVASACRSKYASRYTEKNFNFQRFNSFYCDFLYSFWNILIHVSINVEKWFLNLFWHDWCEEIEALSWHFSRVNRYKFWNREVAGLPSYTLEMKFCDLSLFLWEQVSTENLTCEYMAGNTCASKWMRNGLWLAKLKLTCLVRPDMPEKK